MQPLIGISCSQNLTDRSLVIWEAYIRAVRTAGGLPVILPILEDREAVGQYAEMLDGLLLSGGVDIDTQHYGEETLAGYTRQWPITPERDTFEISLTQVMLELDKPILGICRGAQLINVAAGGSLYQDLGFQSSNSDRVSDSVSNHVSDRLCHFQEAPWWYPTHKVELVPDTKLAQILPQRPVLVNSLHHQAVRNLALGFLVNARAADGTIEGIESVRHTFAVGVQWHPELMLEKDETWLRLFAGFVGAVSGGCPAGAA